MEHAPQRRARAPGCGPPQKVGCYPCHTSLIGRIGQNRDDEIIIKAMTELGHTLGECVVAEGVETEQQLEFLRERGCDEAQGFLLAPPVEASELIRWLTPSALEVRPVPDIRRATRAG